jgi:hypothetical protein
MQCPEQTDANFMENSIQLIILPYSAGTLSRAVIKVLSLQFEYQMKFPLTTRCGIDL